MERLHVGVDTTGALFNGLYDHKELLVTTPDAYLRGCAAGFNVQIRGEQVLLHPRISRTDFEALQDLSLQSADDVLQTLLGEMSLLPKHKREKFMVDRAAVWKPIKNGGYRMVLVPRVPKAVDEIDLIQGLPIELALQNQRIIPAEPEELESRQTVKVYQLMQVFNDKTVLDKYQVSLRQLEAAKRLAATDSTAAARLLQEAMNSVQTNTRVEIKAQAWTKSKKQAVHTLNYFCKEYPYVDLSFHIDIVKDTIFMYAPDNSDWCVSGPVIYTEQVRALHALVAREGYVFPSVLLSMECTLLKINLGTKYDVSEPSIIYHAGNHINVTATGVAEDTARILPVAARVNLDVLARRLHAIKDVDDNVIATAVRITDDYVLVNNHVLADTERKVHIGSDPIVPVAQISRDIWTVKAPGDSEPWQIREPVVDEMVIICGMGKNGFYVSPPVRVLQVNDTNLMLERSTYVVPGMSGAAIVSLRGFSLLGIHSAVVGNKMVGYRFTANHLSEMIMGESSAPSSVCDSDELGKRVMRHFKKHGLVGLFRKITKSMLQLFDDEGEHVGMAAVLKPNYMVTSCDVSRPLLLAGDKVPIEWTTVSLGVYGAKLPLADRSIPPLVRAPKVLERVFLLGWDGSPYIAGESRVSFVGVDATSFVIRKFESKVAITGGLIMAWDGAVLGIASYVSEKTQVGAGIRCWPLPDMPDVEISNPRSTLERVFPFLHVAAWPEEVIDQIFTSSANELLNAESRPTTNRCLAAIGKAALIAVLYKDLHRYGMALTNWKLYEQELLKVERFGRMNEDFELSSLRRYADIGPFVEAEEDKNIVLAIVGAVYELEDERSLQLILKSLHLTLQAALEIT